MKKTILLLLFTVCFSEAWAQYHTSEARTWDKYPPEAQLKGFGLNKSQLVRMDNDPQLKEVCFLTSTNSTLTD